MTDLILNSNPPYYYNSQFFHDDFFESLGIDNMEVLMPAKWVHYYFAKDMAKDHNFSFKKDKSYYFGALGPDFLTYLPENLLAYDVFGMFHEEKTQEILCYVFDHLEQEEIRSYLYGFLAHYALDSGSSFFINSLRNEGFDRQSVKAALDEAILRRRKLRPDAKLSFHPLINLGKNIPEAIAEFYQQAAEDVYEIELSTEMINMAYQRFIKTLRVSASPLYFLQIRSNWYDKPPEQLFSKEVSEKLYQEFLESYEDSRKFFRKLLSDKSPCAERNFHGDFL